MTSTLDYHVVSSETSSHVLMIRYANGTSAARPGAVIINGNNLDRTFLNYQRTGSWEDWHTETLEVTLTTGLNTITLVSENSNGMPNIDSLSVSGNSMVTTENCHDPVVPGIETGTMLTHDFNNGNMHPFVACTVELPNYTRVIDGRVTTFWTESGHNGTRMTKGAELCHDHENEEELSTTKHGWMGFTVNVDTGHSRQSESAIAQVFGFDLNRSLSSWEGLLEIINGDLVAVHRRGTLDVTHATVVENFEYGVDHNIIIGFTLSSQFKGKFKVWVNGELKYSATGIGFGFGSFDSNTDQQNNNTYTTFKLGQYNHTQDYTAGEVRVVHYDNVTWYSGEFGYDIVSPE